MGLNNSNIFVLYYDAFLIAIVLRICRIFDLTPHFV